MLLELYRQNLNFLYMPNLSIKYCFIFYNSLKKSSVIGFGKAIKLHINCIPANNFYLIV